TIDRQPTLGPPPDRSCHRVSGRSRARAPAVKSTMVSTEEHLQGFVTEGDSVSVTRRVHVAAGGPERPGRAGEGKPVAAANRPPVREAAGPGAGGRPSRPRARRARPAGSPPPRTGSAAHRAAPRRARSQDGAPDQGTPEAPSEEWAGPPMA